MSLYNMLFGYNVGTVLLAPMLTDENPQSFFPRFRDCYTENGNIVVYTRVGGGNRSWHTVEPHEKLDGYDESWDFGEDALYRLPTFIETYDDDFDPTYGYYVFGVPEEWKRDYDLIMGGRFDEVSDAYRERVFSVFPDIDGIDFGDGEIVERMGAAPDWRGYFDGLATAGEGGE